MKKQLLREWSQPMKLHQAFPRMKRMSILILLVSFVASLAAAPVTAAPEMTSFIVQGSSTHAVAALVQSYGGTVTSQLDLIRGVGASLPAGNVDRLLAEPEITSITHNGSVRLADQGNGVRAPETDYPDVVGADYAWEQGATGDGVTVAVVDTGLSRHPGLVNSIDGKRKDRIVGWADFVDPSRAPRDPNGHGTHIAGIIANTQMGNDGEWNGVAPAVNLVGVRVLDERGFGTYEQVIQGIQWVIEQKDDLGIQVMNLSLVSPVQSPYWADPLNQAVMQAWAEGITVVVAAGNQGPGPMSIGVPGNNPYVITVGGFTDNYTPEDWRDDFLAPFSSAGPTLDGFAKPDVVAPGGHIVSSMMPGSYISRNHTANNVSPNYFSMAGTSQAAAVVSGIAALTLSNNSQLSPDEVKFRIMYTSFPWIDLETTEAVYSLWQQGAGRVNAPDAVFADITGTANNGMNIHDDLDGKIHYEGFSYYNAETGEFRLKGEYSAWNGGYGAWAGGYGAWAGGYGAWAGGYGAWAGGYGAWAGGYGAWAGGYGAWAGSYGAWAGGYGAWAGGYGAWAGGYGAWAGAYSDPVFVERFVHWRNDFGNWSDNLASSGTWVNFDG
jgi:serine protease AprX